MKAVKLQALLLMSGLLWASNMLAQQGVQQDFGAYRVHYAVFNSSFIDPDIAALHGLTRGANIALVNLALTRREGGAESLGLPARVSGRVQNLLGQSRNLDFIQVQEGPATYYLASFPISDGDVQHFFLSVTPEGAVAPLEVRFTRTLYRDR